MHIVLKLEVIIKKHCCIKLNSLNASSYGRSASWWLDGREKKQPNFFHATYFIHTIAYYTYSNLIVSNSSFFIYVYINVEYMYNKNKEKKITRCIFVDVRPRCWNFFNSLPFSSSHRSAMQKFFLSFFFFLFAAFLTLRKGEHSLFRHMRWKY